MFQICVDCWCHSLEFWEYKFCQLTFRDYPAGFGKRDSSHLKTLRWCLCGSELWPGATLLTGGLHLLGFCCPCSLVGHCSWGPPSTPPSTVLSPIPGCLHSHKHLPFFVGHLGSSILKSTLHSESKCWGLFGSAKYLLALKGAGVFPDCPRSAVSRGRACFSICGVFFPSVHGFFDRQACYIRFPVGGLCLLNTVLSFTV